MLTSLVECDNIYIVKKRKRDKVRMKISEVIKELEKILATEGDLRVTVYDEYTAAEGWDYKNEDLWLDTSPCVTTVYDDNDKAIEKVVQF